MPEIQVFPMSDDYLSNGQTIAHFFNNDLKTVSLHRPEPGRFNFKGQGVTAPPGSLLLFQYKGRLVAHAELVAQSEADAASPLDSRGFFRLHLDTLKYYKRPFVAKDLHHLWPGLTFNQRKHKLDASQRQAFEQLSSTR